MSILRLQGYRCSMNHAFTYSPMWNKQMLQPSKWMRNLIPILYVVIALAQANKLRPAPIVPNPLLCRAIPSPSQPHSSHPSLFPYLEKEHIRSQNARSCDRMFSFDAKHVPSGYFVKRIFDRLSIFITSDNFAGLLLLKTTSARSRIRTTEKNLSHQQNPAGKSIVCGEFNN